MLYYSICRRNRSLSDIQDGNKALDTNNRRFMSFLSDETRSIKREVQLKTYENLILSQQSVTSCMHLLRELNKFH